jgi:hypothetical protein
MDETRRKQEELVVQDAPKLKEEDEATSRDYLICLPISSARQRLLRVVKSETLCRLCTRDITMDGGYVDEIKFLNAFNKAAAGLCCSTARRPARGNKPP